MFKQIFANIVIALYTHGNNIFSFRDLSSVEKDPFTVDCKEKWKKINSFYGGYSEVNNDFLGIKRIGIPIYRILRRQMEEDASDFFLENSFNLPPQSPVNWSFPTPRYNEFINFNKNVTNKNLSFTPFPCELNSKIILPLHIKSFVNLIKFKKQKKEENAIESIFLNLRDSSEQSVEEAPFTVDREDKYNVEKLPLPDTENGYLTFLAEASPNSKMNFSKCNIEKVEEHQMALVCEGKCNVEKLSLLQKLKSWVTITPKQNILHPNHNDYDLYSNNNIHHTFAMLFMDW